MTVGVVQLPTWHVLRVSNQPETRNNLMAICQAWFRHALSARQRRARRRKARRQHICDLAQACNARVSHPCWVFRQLSLAPEGLPKSLVFNTRARLRTPQLPATTCTTRLLVMLPAELWGIGGVQGLRADGRRTPQAIPMDVFMNCEVPTVSSNAQSRNQKACALFGRRPLCHWGSPILTRRTTHRGRPRACRWDAFVPMLRGFAWCSVALVQVLDLLDSDDEDQVCCAFGIVAAVMCHDAMVPFMSPGGAADRVGSLG